MKTFLLTVAACGLLLTGTAKEPLYRDSSAPLAERVDDLLSRMTLREKLGQLSREHQIICITHLPQIAAMEDVHFLIEKQIEG